MYLTRLAVAAAIAAGGLSVGLAGPAGAADPHALGTYTFEAEDGESATWTISPCSDDTDHCVYVVSSGNSQRAPWSGNAYWTVGSWILFVDQPDAIMCPGGGSAPGRNNYSWDATSLSGYASIFSGGACGGEAESIAIPFQLTKVGSGPIQYPTAPVQVQPLGPPAGMPPLPAEGPAAGGPMPTETDPAIVATPPAISTPSDQLTEQEVAEPGFNGGGHR